MTGPFTDTAVGDGVPPEGDAFAFIERPQVVGGFEGTVLLDRLRPWDVGGPRDMAATLRRLAYARWGDHFAAEFIGGAHVNQIIPSGFEE
jgi:hypothetical protein